MSSKAVVENQKKFVNVYQGRRLEIRFLDAEQLDLVSRAAKLRGQTMSGWAVGVILAAARKIVQNESDTSSSVGI